ncbi:glycerate kinase [Chengkuizengella sediminis]|uniref:glycerate kinase n=1 Tax=Chengkuizengella sediminis TaxID=1885917 RepID=UPI001389FC27|nr:glycerate kinase [Chengkuizengella sediminis]NDI35286.1 glycerate kinase [Chengkuizengella sediminis]
MKIVIVPDSYKGSLSAFDVGTTIKEGLASSMKGVEFEIIPMADGGEGTLDTLISTTNGQLKFVEVTGVMGEAITTCYGILGDNKTVVIEIAKIVGIPMLSKTQRNPMLTTTVGIGEVMLHVMAQGFRHFIIGLGGSATNDGGLGLLSALGVTFLDHRGERVESKASSLKEIYEVDFSTLDPRLKECEIKIASDVENPLCGEHGATVVYGAQKGATKQQVKVLDTALSKYASLIELHLHDSFQNKPGAGAAGGLGFAFLALEGQMFSGAKTCIDATGLREKIKDADLVITGEGQSDYQTLYGKVPIQIAKLAKEYQVDIILISGALGEDYEKLYEFFNSCFSIAPGPITLELAMKHTKPHLFEKARNIGKLLNLGFIK